MCPVKEPRHIKRKKQKCRGSLWAGLHKGWFTDNRLHQSPDFKGKQGLFAAIRCTYGLPTENGGFSEVEKTGKAGRNQRIGWKIAGYAPIIPNLQTNRNETGGVLDNGLPPDSPENLADTD